MNYAASDPAPPSTLALKCFPPGVGASLLVPTAAGGYGAWVLVAGDIGAVGVLVTGLVVQAAAAVDTVVVDLGTGAAGGEVPVHSIRLGQIGANALYVPLPIAGRLDSHVRLAVRAAGAAATNLRVGLNYAVLGT